MAKNELYVRPEFGVEKVYQKLTAGLEDLTAQEAVDVLLGGADVLRQGINQVIDRIYQAAEENQTVVVGDKTNAWHEKTAQVKNAVAEAGTSGDYEGVERKLWDATMATLAVKEAVQKMKYIKQRGQVPYEARRALSTYVREIEDSVKKPKVLTGEVLSREKR